MPNVIKKMIKSSIENQHLIKTIQRRRVNKNMLKSNQKRMPILIKKVLRNNNKSHDNKQD